MNIFVPRSISETSIPFLIKNIREKFEKINKIKIITRYENSEIMKNIPYVDDVLIINTKDFETKSIIKSTYIIDKNDIIIIPISNFKKIKSYRNVLKFIRNNFHSSSKIYYYDFSVNKIDEFKKIYFNLSEFFYVFLTVILFIPLLIILLIITLFNLIKK